MTAPVIIVCILAIPTLAWLLLILDLWWFRRYRVRRDQRSNAAWWAARKGKDGE